MFLFERALLRQVWLYLHNVMKWKMNIGPPPPSVRLSRSSWSLLMPRSCRIPTSAWRMHRGVYGHFPWWRGWSQRVSFHYGRQIADYHQHCADFTVLLAMMDRMSGSVKQPLAAMGISCILFQIHITWSVQNMGQSQKIGASVYPCSRHLTLTCVLLSCILLASQLTAHLVWVVPGEW